MSQIGGGISTVQSLGAGRHRDIPQDLSVSIGTSISSRFDGSEWEARESQRQRELEETRARAAQMEKTMKWWSDCTANWREKWSKVRNERNKSRDEAKQLRTSLEAAIKESNLYKREKSDLEIQIIQLKKEMENIHMLLIKQSGHIHKSIDSNCLNIEEHILQGAISNNLPELITKEESAEEKHLIQQLSKNESDEEYLLQKISVLQLKLDEAQKLYQIEKEEKYSLHKNIEKLSLEMREMKEKYDEMREAKQEAVRELLTLQEQHRAEVRILNNTIQEEISSRENFERRLCELRNELERLQSENALEWGKRERLETEKIGLERDNKKLRAEIREMMGRCDKKGRPISNTDLEIQTLQTELTERNKEIGEIKHSHIKLQKVLAEANTELGHAVRRAEQYETEVKRLRTRIEELKGELAGAEDELDVTCNQVRRLQRINEELSEKTEDLQVQVQHLQTKLPNYRSTNLSLIDDENDGENKINQ